MSSQIAPTSQQSLMSAGIDSIPLTSNADIQMSQPMSADMMELGSQLNETAGAQRFAQPRVQREIDQLAISVRHQFAEFLASFQEGNEVVYRQLILRLEERCETTLWVQFNHVLEHSEQLAKLILSDYVRFEPYLEEALFQCVERLIPDYARVNDVQRDIKIAIYGLSSKLRMRELKSDYAGRLISFKATITRTSIVRPELVVGCFQCKDCGEIVPNVTQQNVYTPPIRCPSNLCFNSESWDLLISRSKFVDWQKLRVQETSDEIPSGNLPRSIDVIVRHDMCERAKPGDVCELTGTLIAVPDVSQVMMSGRHIRMEKKTSGRQDVEGGVKGLKKLGCREMSFRFVFIAKAVQTAQDRYAHFYSDESIADNVARSDMIARLLTHEQREEMLHMIDSKTNYEDLIESICPTIYGHTRVKEGLLLLLLGGVHKFTPEGTNKLRGDINVCLVGDPGVSKSQFLKYVAHLLPRGIYTSGKASSAAGLTASVVKDEETGDFTIEAGALMLADNGICCIDEFDKMDIKDQVAIHEAMEQQTISIAKAGIHATLNARTSILAAANPIGGRYDKSKTLRANVAMSPPIMSRFDLFFVILDEPNEEKDFLLAKHILKVHRDPTHALHPPYTIDQLRRFILFTRALKPKLTSGARELLQKRFVSLRQMDNQGKNGFRITVRQLESLIRLSEAMARAQADSEVKPKHVNAAYLLFQRSIIQRESEDLFLDEDDEEPETTQVTEQAQPEEGDAMAEDNPEHPAEDIQKPRTKMSEDEYVKITRMMIGKMYRKRMDAKRRAAARDASTQQTDEEQQDEDDGYGMTVAELRDWYLELIENKLDSEEDYKYHSNLIIKILKRMVKKDRVLMAPRAFNEVEENEEVKITDRTLLAVAPNIAYEEFADIDFE